MNTVTRQLSASQGKRLQEKPNLRQSDLGLLASKTVRKLTSVV